MSNSETIIATVAPHLSDDESVMIEYMEKMLNLEDFTPLIGMIPQSIHIGKINGLIFCDMKQVCNSNKVLWTCWDQNQMSEILISLMDHGCFVKNGRAVMEQLEAHAEGFVHKDTVIHAFYNIPHGCLLYLNSKYELREGDEIKKLYDLEDIETDNVNVLENLITFRNLCRYNKYLKRILLESYFHFTLVVPSGENVLHIAQQLFGNAEVVQHESVTIGNTEELAQHISTAIELGEEIGTSWPFHIDAEIKPLVIANAIELDLLVSAAH